MKRLDFSRSLTKFEPSISACQPGDGLLVRPLCPSDYDKGFVQLLGQLTKIGDVTREQFLSKYFYERDSFFISWRLVIRLYFLIFQNDFRQ